jgi:hypothetical protein
VLTYGQFKIFVAADFVTAPAILTGNGVIASTIAVILGFTRFSTNWNVGKSDLISCINCTIGLP